MEDVIIAINPAPRVIERLKKEGFDINLNRGLIDAIGKAYLNNPDAMRELHNQVYQNPQEFLEKVVDDICQRIYDVVGNRSVG